MNDQEQTETETEVETVTETKVATIRTRVSMEDFITAWEKVATSDSPSVQAVSDILGLKPESVQQRATKYRHPAKKKKLKDGTEVEIPVAERGVAIALTMMPRGGGPKVDTNAGAAFLAKLREKKTEKEVEPQTQEGE